MKRTVARPILACIADRLAHIVMGATATAAIVGMIFSWRTLKPRWVFILALARSLAYCDSTSRTTFRSDNAGRIQRSTQTRDCRGRSDHRHDAQLLAALANRTRTRRFDLIVRTKKAWPLQQMASWIRWTNGSIGRKLRSMSWYNCDQWNGRDYRKNDAPKLGIDEARQQFDAQATQLSQQDKQVKALPIGVTLR